MADQSQGQSIQASLVTEMGRMIEPLEALSSPQEVVFLLQLLGWGFPDSMLPSGFNASAGAKIQIVENGLHDLFQATTEKERVQKAEALLPDIASLVGSLATLPDDIKSVLSGQVQFRDNSGIEADLFRRLLDLLVVAYLRSWHPAIYRLGGLLGLIDVIRQDEDTTKFRLAAELPRIEWERFPKLLTDPLGVAEDAYEWGGDFMAELFLTRLGLLVNELGLPAAPVTQDPRLRSTLGRATGDTTAFRLPFVYEAGPAGVIEGGIEGSPAPASGQAKKGLALFPYLEAGTEATLEFGGWKFSFAAMATLDKSVGLILRPPHDLQVQANMFSTPSPPVSGGVKVSIGRSAKPGETMVLFGAPDKTRVTMESLAVSLAGQKDGDRLELAVEAQTKALAAYVVPGDGDGFLQKILPAEGIGATLDFGIGYSTVKGVYFPGAAALEVRIPVHLSIGDVLKLDAIYVRGARQASGALEGVVAVDAGIKLGPIAGSVERVGLRVTLDVPPAGSGKLGFLDPKLGFKPPNGAGMSVGAGPVKGGGYLFFDEQDEQYAGVLQLEFQMISLKAIGLLTTRMPDGSHGFSLLVIITAEFSSGIQLGYGFTLNGVGGLIGINRTLIKEALQAGIRTGSIGNILFPVDPVARAPQLLSDLRTIFPPAPDSFVVGPMAKLGWGGMLISLELGIILQLPKPLRLLILGRISLKLPPTGDPVLGVNLDVLGIIDFDEGEVSLDAALVDSRLVVFTLTGQMAARLGWSKTPHFEMAAGGLHPNYPAPPGFPKLDRLALALAQSDNPRFRMECYFALTSNSLQFGAALDFHVHVDIWAVGLLSVDAKFNFDALMKFPPLSIQADLSVTVDLKRNGKSFLGVWLDLHLTGPTPWHAWGQASFECLGRHSIPIDITVGDPVVAAALAASNPLVLLLEALADPTNWSAQPPAQGQALVTLTDLDPGPGEVFVHPLGNLTVRQRVAPLGIQLQKFGDSAPEGPMRFDVTDVSLGGQPAESITEAVREYFAAARFLELSDDQKLSRPGFEAFEAGRRIGTSGVDAPAGFEAAFGYEDIVVDVEPVTRFMRKRQTKKTKEYKPSSAVQASHARFGSTSTYAAPGVDAGLDEPVYVVAGTDDLQESSDVQASAADGLSYTEASQRRDEYLASHPGAADRLQVVGAHEVAG